VNHLYLFGLLHETGKEKNEVFMNTEKELLKIDTLSLHWMKHLPNFLSLAEYGCFKSKDKDKEEIPNRITRDLLMFSDMPIHEVKWISTSEHSKVKESIVQLNELSLRINQLIRDLEYWFNEEGFDLKNPSVQKIIHNVHRGIYNGFERPIEKTVEQEIALLKPSNLVGNK